MQHERVLGEVERDKEAWEPQCLARQLYIQHTIKQIYKTIYKAHDMFEKAKALNQEKKPKTIVSKWKCIMDTIVTCWTLCNPMKSME